jgi:NAD(P)-dependent dehydrogenase (short-subunit alcohol dehydrogenase family)
MIVVIPRVALVTGTSSGIGGATATVLAQNGFRTFGTVRSEIPPL